MGTYRDMDDKTYLKFLKEIGITKECIEGLSKSEVIDTLSQDYSNKELEDIYCKVSLDETVYFKRRVLLDNSDKDYSDSTKYEIDVLFSRIVGDKKEELEKIFEKGIESFIETMYNTAEDSKYTRFLVDALAKQDITFQDIINSKFNLRTLVSKQVIQELDHEFISMKVDSKDYEFSNLSKDEEATVVEELRAYCPELQESTLLNYFNTYVDKNTKNEILRSDAFLIENGARVMSIEEIKLLALRRTGLSEKDLLLGNYNLETAVDDGIPDSQKFIKTVDWGEDKTNITNFLRQEFFKITEDRRFYDLSKREVINLFYSRLSRTTRETLAKKYKYSV